jgi:hypothetical protein
MLKKDDFHERGCFLAWVVRFQFAGSFATPSSGVADL